MTKLNRLTLTLAALILTACPSPEPVTQAEPPCPCPSLALTHHPEDPDSPGPCRVKSRSGVLMDAEDHPRCAEEARDRAGREGR